MVAMREGFLSDENMKKICALHRPIPMHRLDLLPRPMTNRSALYSRPLKEPKVISRPQTAQIMLNQTERLTGRDLSIDYKKALSNEPRMPNYPKLPGAPSGLRTTPIYGNFIVRGPSIADVAYQLLADLHSIPTGTDLAVVADVDDSVVESVDESEDMSPNDESEDMSPNEEPSTEDEDERNERLEISRRIRYTIQQQTDEDPFGLASYRPVVSQTAPPATPQPARQIFQIVQSQSQEQEIEPQMQPSQTMLPRLPTQVRERPSLMSRIRNMGTSARVLPN
jgi:hypothetical protein